MTAKKNPIHTPVFFLRFGGCKEPSFLDPVLPWAGDPLEKEEERSGWRGCIYDDWVRFSGIVRDGDEGALWCGKGQGNTRVWV